jgi:hypothetical protein
MSLEYHAWIVLATSDADWGDGDFKQAFDLVEKLLAGLSPEEGHSAIISGNEIYPRIVYLSACDVPSIEHPVEVMKRIAQVFDKAYGELVAGDVTEGDWIPSRTDRYVLTNRQLTPTK